MIETILDVVTVSILTLLVVVSLAGIWVKVYDGK